MIHPATLRDDWNYPTQRLGRILGVEDPSLLWRNGVADRSGWTLGVPEPLGAFDVLDNERARVAAGAIDPTAGT